MTDTVKNQTPTQEASAVRMGFGTKLTAVLLLAALIPFVIALTTTINVSKRAFEEQAVAKLESLRYSKGQEIENYLEQIRDQILTLSESEMTLYSAQQFTDAFFKMPEELELTGVELSRFRRDLGEFYENEFDSKFTKENGKSSGYEELVPSTAAEIVSQHQYIAANPSPLGSKEALNAAQDGTSYARVHGIFHDRFRSYLQKFGYYDIFIVEPDSGHIVYSVYKELDYGTSLIDGPYKDTNFARVFRKAAAAKDPNAVFIEDFERYVPSYNAPASFISSPIYADGSLVGVLIFQMPVDRVNEVMRQETGMGESGEIVLVGDDQLMRSQSRLTEDPTILTKAVKHAGVEAALAGKVGTTTVVDAAGVESIVSYSPLEFLGMKWAVVASVQRDEALKASTQLITLGTIVGLVSLLAIIAVAIFFRRSVMKQLGADPTVLQSVSNNIANGRFDETLETQPDPAGVFASMVKMQKALRERIEADRKTNEINLRIRMALDSVRSSVMMVNAEGVISYLNPSAQKMFVNNELSLRRQLSSFDAAKLEGGNVSVFGTDSNSVRNLLDNLQASKKIDISISEHSFNVTATPIFDDFDKRIGAVVEWVERTQERAVAEEMQSIINAAKNGDLSRRINLQDKEGIFNTLSDGVNNLVDVSNNVVGDTVRVLSALAKGQLTERINKDYEGSFGALKADANKTIDNLIEVVTEIKGTADSVTRNATEIANGNSNLSHRTEQQASNLEQTASSMEEMTATVKQNSDNAQQANQLALNAREQAETGGKVVGEAVSAMREINESSKQIADIISVIDEIAFQTNLLALNASVEAARAGEQGRGFAVVASEVRNLAGRSATAAKEIKDLIEDSVTKVEGGAALVDKSGETLNEIVISVKKVTDIVGEIAAASREQSIGIEQVNNAVMQMDEVTQQNTALVEEAAAASAAMGEEANQLKELVSFFTFNEPVHAKVPMTETPKLERRHETRPWSQSGAPSPAKDSGSEGAQKTLVPEQTDFAPAATGTDDWEEF